MKPKMLVPLLTLVLAAALAEAQEKAAPPVSVDLVELGDSGESGTATLTGLANGHTRVQLVMQGAPKATPQPAHIHEGTCDRLNPQPKWGLENVVDGRSLTEVPIRLERLTEGGLAINVHKSTDDIRTYVACGPIPKR